MSWLHILLAFQMVLIGQLAPPFVQGGEPTVSVQGQIVNRTTDKPVEESLETMLHIFTVNGQQLGMLHGESGPDGHFSFDEVPYEDGSSVVAMTNYEGANYQSDPAALTSEGAQHPIEIPVFDATSTTDSLTIETMHLLLAGQPSRLFVTELYVLANGGDYTVTIPAEGADKGGLRFFLPPNASNIAFPDQDPERFKVIDGGFFDTTPLVPGTPSSTTVARFDLPYEPGATLQHDLPLAVERISLLIPASLGISPADSQIQSLGTRNFPEQGLYDLYALPPLTSNQPLELKLEGEITAASETDSAQPVASGSSDANLVIGLAGLGLSLIGIAAWWLMRIRRTEVWDEPTTSE